MRNLFWGVARVAATVLVVAVVAWLCVEAAPGDPAEAAAQASGRLPVDASGIPLALRRAIVEEARARLGIDETVAGRLAAVVKGLVRGDLGRSWRDGEAVSTLLAAATPTTIGLIVTALALAYLAGIAGALVAARRPAGVGDRFVGAVAAMALAVPPAWAAILALRAPQAASPWGARIAAVVCLGYGAAAIVARHGRAALVEALASPVSMSARARGASTTRVLWVHATALAFAALATLPMVLVPYLLGASLVVERAFDLRGLGALLLEAAARKDAPVLVGCAVTAATIVAAGSWGVDMARRAVDPRLGEEVPGR